MAEIADHKGLETFGRQATWKENAGPVIHQARVACNQVDRSSITVEKTCHNRARVSNWIGCRGLEGTVAVPEQNRYLRTPGWGRNAHSQIQNAIVVEVYGEHG